MNSGRSVSVIERRLDAAPLRDDVPGRAPGEHPLHPHLEYAIEDLVSRSLRDAASPRIERRLGRPDLLDVRIGLDLVKVIVANHVVAWIQGGRLLTAFVAKAGAVDHLRNSDVRLDHHVGAACASSGRSSCELRLEPAAKAILAAIRELIVDVHLVPGELVHRDHRARRAKTVYSPSIR